MPDVAHLSLNQAIELALQHHQAGRLNDAETIYRRVLAVAPEHPVALHYLGVLAHQLGRHTDAIELITRSVALLPRGPYYSNLGEAYRAARRFDEAADAFRKAIELDPTGPAQHNNLGLLYLDRGEIDAAEPLIQRAMELSATYAPAQNNLGTVRHKQGKLEDAERFFRRAIELDPKLAPAYANLANILAAQLRLDEAADYAQTAVRMAPDDAHSHLILAQIRLLAGDFERGWPEYEWRVRKFPFLFRKFDPQPRWTGQALEGETILLYAEQGFGDTIQFARFIPMVSQRCGGRVIVECQKELADLIATAGGAETIVRQGEPLPKFDTWCSLVSLPGVLKTTLQSIPKQVPYLRADDAQVATWRARLESDGARLRVGLVWAGNPTHEKDRERSCRLDDLAPLADVEGVVFYSLQKGEPANQAHHPPSGMKLIDVSSDLRDFSASAALVSNLDLVISVDTAAAHLAGALGKNVWTMLSFVPEWRWMHERGDSPWYPTMRLFRQQSWGDWNDVARTIAGKLERSAR